MSWQGPPDTARTWPGAHLPPGAHPRGTTYNSFGVPQYPPGTTCDMLGEHDLYFPLGWHLIFMFLLAFLFYFCWPFYVMWLYARNKSVFTDQKAFEANHDKYRKYGQKSAPQGSDSE